MVWRCDLSREEWASVLLRCCVVMSYKTYYVLSVCVCVGCRDTKSLQVQVWLQTTAVGLEKEKHHFNITMLDIRLYLIQIKQSRSPVWVICCGSGSCCEDENHLF